jgi:hypothetical protein
MTLTFGVIIMPNSKKPLKISRKDAERKESKMVKVPFEIVNTQVEALFAGGLKEDETVDERLLAIDEFVEACGWQADEFELYRKYGVLN